MNRNEKPSLSWNEQIRNFTIKLCIFATLSLVTSAAFSPKIAYAESSKLPTTSLEVKSGELSISVENFTDNDFGNDGSVSIAITGTLPGSVDNYRIEVKRGSEVYSDTAKITSSIDGNNSGVTTIKYEIPEGVGSLALGDEVTLFMNEGLVVNNDTLENMKKKKSSIDGVQKAITYIPLDLIVIVDEITGRKVYLPIVSRQ